jgi:hypothetical protein
VKYMEKGGFQNNPLMKLTLGLTLVFLAGLWVTNLLMFTSKMALNPSSIAAYYRGSEADFLVPRTYQSMLEVTHMHLPIMAIVILMLTHLLIFAPFSNRMKVTVIVGSFGSALLGEASGWLVRFVHPGFAYLKLGVFLIFQALLMFLILALAWFLATGKNRRARVEAE